jgi:hypothetical protein
MSSNPYESPASESPVTTPSRRERFWALAYSVLAAFLFVVIGFPGALGLAFGSMVHPDLQGADRSRAVATRILTETVQPLLFGYMVLLFGLFCGFFIFLFAAAAGIPSIRRACQIAVAAGVGLALWTYAYIVACSYGWIDSCWLK